MLWLSENILVDFQISVVGQTILWLTEKVVVALKIENVANDPNILILPPDFFS